MILSTRSLSLLLSGLLLCALWARAAHAAGETVITSPSGTVQGSFSLDAGGALQYRLTRSGVSVIETSPLGISIGGLALGSGVTLGTPATSSFSATYPLLGAHGTATNSYTQMVIPVTHLGSGTTYSLEVRAFDDGLAYRYVVPGSGQRIINSEQSSWKIPDGTNVWFFERNSSAKLQNYSGTWMSTNVNNLPTISAQGPVQGAGLTLELPNGGGYAVLSEAGLANYSGLRLEAIGSRTVRANFTEGTTGFTMTDTITTPWRFTLTTPDLNSLANSDLVTNLSPDPDATLYGDSTWIKPGRSVWRWISYGTGTPDQERAYVDYAAEMGFEYSTVDASWEDLFSQNGQSKWDNLKQLCDYARTKGVGIFVWKNSERINNPANDWGDMRTYFDKVKNAGAVGLKIDYLNAESTDRIALELAAMRKGAERKLLINFHGISKPTGESRTFPNQLTREAVRGLEAGLPGAEHDAALPFTRFVQGPADYTPLAYTNNYAEELATDVIYTSPLQVISSNPDKMLHDPVTAPALEVVKAIPTVWDETRVLAPSAIGKLAVLARRKGAVWFLALINGDKNNGRTVNGIDLSFLGASSYNAILLSSGASDASLVRQDLAGLQASNKLDVTLLKAGGFVAMFTPDTPAATDIPTSTPTATATPTSTPTTTTIPTSAPTATSIPTATTGPGSTPTSTPVQPSPTPSATPGGGPGPRLQTRAYLPMMSR